MVYKIDYVDGDVLRWSVTETGVKCEVDESYNKYAVDLDVGVISTNEPSFHSMLPLHES